MKTLRVLFASLIGLAGIMLLTLSPPPQRGFGWVNNPAAVTAAMATLPCPRFDATEAYASVYTGPEDVFLWDACRKVTGDVLPPRDQGNVGCCVGFGTAAAIEHLICVQAAGDRHEEFRTLSPEAIYAGSRVEIGHSQIRGDGSVGAWAARFVSEYGVLPRDKYAGLDLSKYDPTRCRDLGRRGLTAELEATAKQHPVKTVANVSSWNEAQAAIRNGYPLIVCSSQGFGMTRDAEGFCTPQGTWMHCMALVGVRGGPRPGGFLLNSWGATAHSGPLGLGNPSPAGFWTDARVLDRMLHQGDSWAFSHFTGFPARKLDWYAMRNPHHTHGGQ
ncbi:hypothetical protein BH11PLA2_BH11PLA2_09070 [soil metagenome]